MTKNLLFAALLLSAFAASASAGSISLPTDSGSKAKPSAPGIKSADPVDTAWKPTRRFWGLTYMDYYYDAHEDSYNRGPETNYAGVPTYRNAFQFRRIYLGYDYDINKKFAAEILLSCEPSANTAVSGTTSVSSSDNLADNKMSFFIKLADVRVRDVWTGSDFIMGEQLTPLTVKLTEKIWGYRSVEKTIADLHRSNLYDLGGSLEGSFDPQTKNFGYDLMIGNNSQSALLSAANANTGFYKAFYGDLYAKFLNQSLIFDFYADYMKTGPATALVGGQDHSMIKGFAAYTTPKITFGVEAYTQEIAQGLTNVTNGKVGENARVEAISIYSHGSIYKGQLGFFARYDSYNPDHEINAADAYTVNTNLPAYTPFTKEKLAILGLDYSPAKNVHFMPNVWFIYYQDLRNSTTTGYMPDGHTLVYRVTFFYQFGK
jgi:hypothetical protein